MVGSILREARKRKKLSLEQAAGLCNPYLTAGHLSALENEKKPLIEDRVDSLSIVLEVSKDCLVDALKRDRMLRCQWCKDCENVIKNRLS